MLLQIDLNAILTTFMLPDRNVIRLCNLVGAWWPLFFFLPSVTWSGPTSLGSNSKEQQGTLPSEENGRRMVS